MSLYPSPMPMGDIQQMLMGVPRTSTPMQALRPREGTKIDQDFVNSDFYKDYRNYTGPDTADMGRQSKYFDQMGSSSGMGRLDTAYGNYLKSLEGGSTPPSNQEPFQPTTIKPGPPSPQPSSPQIDISKYRNLFNQNRFQQPQPFMGQGFNPFMGGFGRSARSPMMGGFGGFGGYGQSPMMGGYGSPFGGLGMFGMSPYGGMPNYGMFGGMMSPYMGGMGGMFGGGGMNRPPSYDILKHHSQPVLNLPREKQPIEQQQQMMPYQPTQQPFQNNNFMGNPFMSGLGSMMGSMFGGGYGSNVSNTQANVAQ